MVVEGTDGQYFCFSGDHILVGKGPGRRKRNTCEQNRWAVSFRQRLGYITSSGQILWNLVLSALPK